MPWNTSKESIKFDKHIGRFFYQFKKQIEFMRLCEIRDFNRAMQGNGKLNYDSLLVQYYYLSKYSYAYLCLYYHLFETLFKQRTYENEISVTSIGCGAGLDYIGLEMAAIKNNISFTYKGFDCLKWNYINELETESELKLDFMISCLSLEDPRIPQVLSTDILIFPFSIQELSNDLINAIFSNNSFKDDIVIVYSLRASDSTLFQSDLEKIDTINRFMYSNSFLLKGESPPLNYDPTQYISYYFKNKFSYWKENTKLLSNLADECFGIYDEEDCMTNNNCKCYLNEKPMMKAKFLNYKYFQFRKNHDN
jgi:hypothetical protein